MNVASYIVTMNHKQVNKKERTKKCFIFSLFVGNSYGSVQHVIQYAFLIVVHHLHTAPVATAHTVWLPLVIHYPPANVNTSSQIFVLYC